MAGPNFGQPLCVRPKMGDRGRECDDQWFSGAESGAEVERIGLGPRTSAPSAQEEEIVELRACRPEQPRPMIDFIWRAHPIDALQVLDESRCYRTPSMPESGSAASVHAGGTAARPQPCLRRPMPVKSWATPCGRRPRSCGRSALHGSTRVKERGGRAIGNDGRFLPTTLPRRLPTPVVDIGGEMWRGRLEYLFARPATRACCPDALQFTECRD